MLRCNVHNWISLDQPHAIVKSRVDDRTLVIVEEERVCHPTDSKLTLATEFTIKSKAMLHWIEYKRNILPWNLDGNLVRFELTSLGIAFIRKEDRWHCLQAPGFFIDEDQSFELRGELHGIVLRNSAGKRKLLMKNKMPRYSARKALEKEVSWGDPNEVWPLFFDLEDSTIKASSDPINQVALFLYYTHCERYELAKTLLRQIKREDAEWPKKLLNWIPARGRGQANSNIDAISLRLQLALEVKKRNKRCNLKDYQSDYEEYLRKLSSAQRCPLSEGEERRLLRELSKKEAFKRRQAILDGTTYTPPKPPIQLAIENLHIDHISLDPEQIEEMKQHRSQPAVVPLKINPGSAFAKNFLYYYDCLEPNSPKEGGIKVLLLRSFFMSSGLNCSLHKLLCKIALNPRYWRRLDVDNLEEDLGRLVNSMQNEKALHCPRTEKGERKVGNENVPQLLKSRLQVSEVRVHSAPTTDEIDLKFLVEKRANENAAAQQACLKGLKRVYQDSGFEGQKILAALERKSVEQECYVVKGDAGAQLEQLNRIAQQLEQDSARKREALLELHRRVSGDHRLERDGLVFQPLTLNELVVAFARKDDRRIFEANPYQSAENVHDLKKMLEEFLLIENERNQVIAAIKQVEKIGHEPDAEAKLVQIVLAKRYSQRNPALLAFEYFGKIRLREEQVEKLLQLDTTGNLEIEARTGFGKSKVLIPLWLFLTSQKGQISMMTVPASLLVMQQNHLRAVLGETFDQCVSVIRFNRSKANNVEYLRRLYERLESAKEEGRAILISIRDLHSITNLKLKELYFEKHENEAENLPIKEAEDVKMLLSMLSNFIDESRECLDIQHFYDYAIGVPEPIDREFCRTIWDFYNQAIPLILNKYSLNFCPNKNPELTEELYDSVVKKMLAEHFAEGDLALDLMGNPPAGIVYPEDE
ncbi:MAG: DUF3638 domain-containing protein, partial [Chlamydiae bacterium]|nr:DUF3638 domain-containing protein [Chlamydiota bacterium]